MPIDLRSRESFKQKKAEALKPPPIPQPDPEAELAAKVEAGEPTVPREASFPVRCLGPSGDPLVAEVVSRVPDGDVLDAINREVAKRSGGVPWAFQPLGAYQRAIMLATLLLQCDMPEWLWTRCQEDDVVRSAVYGRAAQHQAAYFRHERDPSTGEIDPQRAGVVVGEIPAVTKAVPPRGG